MSLKKQKKKNNEGQTTVTQLYNKFSKLFFYIPKLFRHQISSK